MIRHDAPSQKAIAFAVEVKERLLDKRRDVRSAKPTRPETSIELVVGLEKVVGKRSEGLGNSLRQAVAQPEGHELYGLRRVKVRQVTAGVPAFRIHDSTLVA
jgi:hypothetical protein